VPFDADPETKIVCSGLCPTIRDKTELGIECQVNTINGRFLKRDMSN